MAREDVAVVGWGRMGGAMGRRLVAAGWHVVACDVDEVARRAAERDGARVVDTPASAASAAEIVVTMLPGPPAIVDSASGPDGLLAGLRRGSLWLEMSSSHPATTRELAAQARAVGAALLDAPVTGGVAGAEAGSLTIIAGGDGGDLDRARAVLEVLGDEIHHVGPSAGDGDLAKTLNNLLSATNLTAAAEALAVGARGGLDPAALVRCLASGTGASHALAEKIPAHVLSGRFEAGFSIREYLKDLGIAVDVAAALDVPVLLGSVTQQTWLRLATSGSGNDDHTRVVAHLAAEAGVRLEGA